MKNIYTKHSQAISKKYIKELLIALDKTEAIINHECPISENSYKEKIIRKYLETKDIPTLSINSNHDA